MMIDVVGVRYLGDFKLEIEFSDGTDRGSRFPVRRRQDRTDGRTTQKDGIFRSGFH